MGKRKLRNTKMRKIFGDSVSSTSNHIGKVRKNYKIAKKRVVDKSSSISLRIKSRHNPPFTHRRRHRGTKVMKQYKTKQKSRCLRNLSAQKKKPMSQNKMLRTCFKNLTYSGSCESVDFNFSGSVVSKPTYQHSYMSMKGCEHPQKSQDVSKLDGVKLVSKRDETGSTTEITFKSALLMHVKKTPAKTDVRSESWKGSESEAMEVSQVNDLLNEVSACCIGPYKRSSSDLLKLALYNDHSKSIESLLRVKSSCNFTDLNSQMKILQLNSHRKVLRLGMRNNASAVPVCQTGSRKTFPSEAMLHNLSDSRSNFVQKAQNSCCGDSNSIHSIVSNPLYTNNNRSSTLFSRSEISRLHHPSGLFPSRVPSTQLTPSNKSIGTHVTIHKEADD